ncbi:MAG: hypothetical protein D6693_04305 [Planctomycetota bacterium]|nr:MAG: hypothetical protein D6693_04305 [Planctomycetota bacterium]
MKKCCIIAAAALAGLGAAGLAEANQVLQFDVNSLTATADGPFGTGFTGTITLVDDGNSSLAGMLIDGANQNIAPNQLGDFTGSISIVGGTVTGGTFMIMDTGGAQYHASIVAGSGSVNASAGQTGPFTIDGLTFAGFFSNLVGGTDFAGVDVSAWDGAPSLSGSFLQFKFGPTQVAMVEGQSLFIDDDADVDIFAVVPTPIGSAMGLAGLACVGVTRRRRA